MLPPDRLGVRRPRPALVWQASYGANVDHLSLHPGSQKLILTENGNLRIVDPSDMTDILADTGWPSGNESFLRPCNGQTTAERIWICPKVAVGSSQTGEPIYHIDAVDNFGPLSVDAPNANWVETYGIYTIAVTELDVSFSSAGDSSDWSALSSVVVPLKLGLIYAFISMADNQALLLGREGAGVWTGSAQKFFAQQFRSNQRVIDPVYTACDCGGRAFVLCPGPSLRAYKGGMEPIHYPILDDLANFSTTRDFRAFYDAVLHSYCLANLFTGRTYFFDLDRNAWMGFWTFAARGMVVTPSINPPEGMDRWLAIGDAIYKMSSSAYQDEITSGAFNEYQVEVRTAPSDMGQPESLKQCTGVFFNGCGNQPEDAQWSLYFGYRNSPREAWTEASIGNLLDPGWCRNIPPVSYRERYIRANCTAAEGVQFISLRVDEQVVSEDT